MASKRVCLAYSGGLDTSTILVWLVQQGYEVVAFIADVGQEENFGDVEKKALSLGAERLVVADLQQEFVDEFIFPAIQCPIDANTTTDLLGTSLARPCIGRAQVKAAKQYNCKILSHGCKYQVRFELAWKACDPTLQVLAPWRIPEFFERFAGRQDLLNFAAQNKIPVSSTPKAPWSMDDNLAHCSYEAGILEQPELTPPENMWTRTVDPMKAPDEPAKFTIHFEKGIPVKVEIGDKVVTGSLEIFKALNEIGRVHGVGRIDIVESRFIGLKSRGCYDTPGLTIARLAHIDLEGLVMDSKVRSLRDRFVTYEWSQCLYNGMYFSPEREFLQHSLEFSQRQVDGKVHMMAFKGNAYVVGRSSETSNLYSETESSMDTLEGFSPMDTSGFIAIQGIRLEKYGARKIKDGEPLARV
ncbi:arginosuccinate synthetase [Metarhizium guizhouense ARSEF 977]|uniref:Argininosuccinate synthase n=1 Tax=Metarhizium guizhouense (strain ARSEF 977) TaxID=1276136 RepID=A0A0B4H5X7_METGA|nr:arginosuccinate synthetase [Metarhizium guizhouense ARSEF 977]